MSCPANGRFSVRTVQPEIGKHLHSLSFTHALLFTRTQTHFVVVIQRSIADVRSYNPIERIKTRIERYNNNTPLQHRPINSKLNPFLVLL